MQEVYSLEYVPEYLAKGGLLPTKLEDRDWDLLIRRINDKKCTPFLGAGAAYGTLPLGSKIARDWAEEYDYPLEDNTNLTRVATYLAVKYDSMWPKDLLLKSWFKDPKPPDFKAPGEPHGALAGLPIPVYMTTNYDSFMVQALRAAGKTPHRELCRWNNFTKDIPSVFDNPNGFEPTSEEPVVYHLHGHDEYVESLVLTEDDYLDFLVSISKDPELLPHHVRRRLTWTSLLFIGYSLTDWNFRVLFRGLINSMEPTLRRISVTVQVPPQVDGDAPAPTQADEGVSAPTQADGTLPASTPANEDAPDSRQTDEDAPAPTQADGDEPASTQAEIQEYLSNYYGKIDIRVYWGTAQNFMQELRTRWDAFKKDNG